MDANQYIERHISSAVMRYLQSNPEIKIEVYSGRRAPCLQDLARRGFDDIRLLSRNYVTDFDQYFAINSETKDMIYVVRSLPGRSFAYEVFYNLLGYSIKRYNSNIYLDPGRITYRESSISVQAEFKETLRSHGVGDPGVVFFANRKRIMAMLKEKGITPEVSIRIETISADYYQVNG